LSARSTDGLSAMTRRRGARTHRFSPRTRHGSVCALVSGGLDSAVLLRQLLRRGLAVQPLYVRSGLRWEKDEIACLRKFLRALRSKRLRSLAIIDVQMADLYGRHWSTGGQGMPGFRAGDASVYLPGRNIALLSKAATFCAMRGIPTLAIGVLNLNPFPDGRPEFFRDFGRALGLGLGAPIRIETPYRALAKDEVIRRGRDLPLDLTLSCARPKRGRHCGVCVKCAERLHAFRRAGVRDPTRYDAGPGAAGSAPGSIARGSPAKRDRTTRVAPKKATRVR
jgi:7-cyano-7-deazaguanine synthase